MAAIMFQESSFLKVEGSLGPHSIILDPSLERARPFPMYPYNVFIRKLWSE